jgi:2-oxoglutarate ferredoxin oxidoreductase subunit alpha
VINSLFLKANELEDHNRHLQAKYKEIKKNEIRYELMDTEDADLIMVAYGTTARICKNVMKLAKAEGINLGLIRPITLWPYPAVAFDETIGSTKHGYLAVEMSEGQMVEDVRLSVEGRKPVHFFGRSGGIVPNPQEILANIKTIMGRA